MTAVSGGETCGGGAYLGGTGSLGHLVTLSGTMGYL